MDYHVNYTRLTLSGRVPDRYLTAQAKIIFSDQKINKGSIFAVVEIGNNWFNSSQIGQSIINALIREYSRSSNSSDLVNFELSLKKVNETLGHITQNGETEWIGKINACLVLVCNDQIHLAKTGKAEAYLIRQNKISSITEGFDQNPELHPLKTFGDIVSGSLKSDDKILVTTPQIFDYFSRENLKQIISKFDTYSAALEIANRLKKEKEKNASAIILELLTKEEATNRDLTQFEDVVYLDQSTPLDGLAFNTREFANNLAPYWEKLQKLVKALAEKTNKLIGILKPKTQKIGNSALVHFTKGHQHLKEKILPQIKEKIKPFSEKIGQKTKQVLEKNQFIPKNSNIRYYTEKRDLLLFPIKQKISRVTKKFLHIISSFVGWLFDPRNRSLFYGLVVVILSIILIFSITSLRSKQSQKEKEQAAVTLLDDSQSKFTNDFKLAILYNDKEKARNILLEILNNVKTITSNNKDIVAQTNQLSSQTQDELDKLDNVNRVKNLQLISEFSASSVFSETHDYIYALNKDSGIVTSSTKTNAHKETINLSSGSKVIAITPSEEKDFSYLLTDKNQLYKVTSPLDQIVEIKSKDENWKTGVSMSVFATNIYILDANGNQIWKYANNSDGFSTVQSYLVSGVNIGDGIDLTIDGAVYVLKKDGGIIKFSKGREQDFKVSSIPKPNETITNPLRIYTNADANYIYALDGNRLLELEKSGKFSAQYVFDGLNDLKDFSLNTKTKEIWLLDGNKIYKGNL